MNRDHLLGFPPVLLGLIEADPSLAPKPPGPKPPPSYRAPPGVQAQRAALDKIQTNYVNAWSEVRKKAKAPEPPASAEPPLFAEKYPWEGKEKPRGVVLAVTKAGLEYYLDGEELMYRAHDGEKKESDMGDIYRMAAVYAKFPSRIAWLHPDHCVHPPGSRKFPFPA